MAISVVGTPSNTGNAASTTSRAPTVPSGSVANDVAVVYLGQFDANSAGATPTVTPPSGFARVGAIWTSSDGKAKNSIYWKRLTTTDSGTYSFSWSGNFWTTAQCVMFRGCIATGDPWATGVGAPVTATGSWGSISTLTLTLPDAGGALFWAVYNDSPATAHTPPTSFTEAADNDCGSCAYRIPGSAGSQSASGASINTTGVAGAWMGALLSTDSATAEIPPQPISTHVAVSRAAYY